MANPAADFAALPHKADVPRWRRLAVMLLWAGAFALAYTQSPLFFSNQNQYFIHGLAEGGVGFLNQDWLANTADPTPVFSAILAFTYRHRGLWLVFGYLALLLAIYFVSLVAIADRLPGRKLEGVGRFAFLTFLVAGHAALPRWLSVQVWGVDYPWYLQCGVAGQYLLGPGLQPSAFGMLLIASIAAFLSDRLVLAAVCVAVAATVHATYLLPGAWLILAYMIALARAGRRRGAIVLGMGSLLAVLPVVWYDATTFAPTTASQFAEAQHLLAHVRIPHHTQIDRWLDPVAWIQLGWMATALALVWRTRLFLILLVPVLGAAGLTVVEAVTHNDTLALLFPWRMSAVIEPVATSVILWRLLQAATSWLESRPAWLTRLAWALSGALLAGVVVGGVVISALGLGYHMDTGELPMLRYIATHKEPGEVYLLPVRIPAVGTGKRGVISTSFTPPPRHKPGSNLIPVDLQRFRAVTGAPIFVDFKSIPYKDVDVLDWYRRLEQCQKWYASQRWDRAGIAAQLAHEGITHVLTPANRPLVGDALEEVRADEHYVLYRIHY